MRPTRGFPMHPMQEFVDAMNHASRLERANYHLTLGALIGALEAAPVHLPVVLDTGPAPGRTHSYRGHYSDLAFEPSERSVTVGHFETVCRRALDKTFTGYKGGDFVMDAQTPLWAAPYGSTGRAIIGVTVRDQDVVLSTKDID